MSTGFRIERMVNLAPELKEAMQAAVQKGLEIVGGKAETYAKGLAPGWGQGTLRNSIGHEVEGDSVMVGSDMELAAYAELGTSIYYVPPEDYMENHVERGKHNYGGAGISRWLYYDEIRRQFMVGAAQHGHHFLRHAVEDHLDEYRDVLQEQLNAVGD